MRPCRGPRGQVRADRIGYHGTRTKNEQTNHSRKRHETLVCVVACSLGRETTRPSTTTQVAPPCAGARCCRIERTSGAGLQQLVRRPHHELLVAVVVAIPPVVVYRHRWRCCCFCGTSFGLGRHLRRGHPEREYMDNQNGKRLRPRVGLYPINRKWCMMVYMVPSGFCVG